MSTSDSSGAVSQTPTPDSWTTEPVPPLTPGIGGPDTGTSKTQAAADSARDVAQDAASRAGEVAGTAKEQAATVVAEAKTQARDIVGEVKGQVSEQANSQRDRLSSALHSLAEELQDLLDGRGAKDGLASDLAQRASDRARGLATHLEGRDVSDLLEDARRFARTRPAAFLAGAAAAGVLAGRLTRGITSDADAPSAEGRHPQAQPLSAGYPTGYTAPAGDASYTAPAPYAPTPLGDVPTATTGVLGDPVLGAPGPGLGTGPGQRDV